MAGPIITQCPKCDTSFRVTEAQLKAAKGAVRCGACLNVFHALNHCVEPQSALASQANDDLNDNDLIDDNFELIMDERPKDPSTKDGEDRFTDDESEFDLELNESFLGLKSGESLSDPFEEETVDTSSNEEDEEDWAKALLADDDTSIDSEAPIKAPETTTATKLTRDSGLSKTPAKPSKKDFALSLDEPGTSSKKKGFFSKKDPSKDESQPSARNKPSSKLPPIEDEPLSLGTQYKPKRTGFIWLFAVLLLTGALAAQYLMYNFNQLSSVPAYRPYIEMLCKLTGCILPSKVAIHKIKTTATPRARKHPTHKNALIVDVLMINTADFAQPFPQIEILFSDQQQKPIASRRFMPGEYLKGELTGITMMPKGKEIHVRFEIVDPGAKATQYEVSFWPLNR
jgi:predicted Zn finger-like uncharacterized protein